MKNKPTGKRRYFTQAEKKAYVDDWERSGLTAPKFAENEGLGPQSLRRWKSVLKNSTDTGSLDEGGGLREVAVREPMRESRQSGLRVVALELSCDAGSCMRIFSDADPGWVAAVLKSIGWGQ